MLENGLEECNCKRKKCERHGKCQECMNHHQTKKHPSPPYCKRLEQKEIKKANKQIHNNKAYKSEVL